MPDIETLYREHRAGLVRLVERELHDHHDAEDVVQTAFLDAQRALERGTIPRNPRAWLAAIALNAARGLRRRDVCVGALEDYAVQEASRLPEIRAAIGELPRNEQTAVVYRDVLGLSYAETAAQMDATVPAVTMLLHRARSRLRRVLGIWLPAIRPGKWLRGSAGQAAAVKAAGAVVLAGGLATAGMGTAQRVGRATAPAVAGIATVAPQAGVPSRDVTEFDPFFGALRRERPNRNRPPRKRASLHARTERSAAASSAAEGAPDLAGLSKPVLSQRQPAVPILAGASTPSVRLPTLPSPSLTLPSPALTHTTATIATPVATATVGVPPGSPEATVSTPVVTVTVSIP